MVPLISQLFDKKQVKQIQNLWEDESCHKVISEVIGQEIAVSKNIIVQHELNQLILLASRADFIKIEEEPVTVAAMIMTCMKTQDIFPSLEKHTGKDFTSRSLVALGFFRPAMQFNYEHRGAPKPEYYGGVAKMLLKNDDMNALADNFDRWTIFLAENFV